MIRQAFSEDDANRAYEEWGCNCGPGALAACLGWTLDEVRPHLATFDAKRYLSGPAMGVAIASTGHRYFATLLDNDTNGFPTHGLALIQFHGPWLNPGVPYAARLKATHWIASKWNLGNHYIFDINGGWLAFDEWNRDLVPQLVEATKRATGEWSVDRSWEVRKAAK